MDEIKWGAGDVGFDGKDKWCSSGNLYQVASRCGCYFLSFIDLVSSDSFQLNEILQGDFILAAELDEQKYNDVLEVFGLFGYDRGCYGNWNFTAFDEDVNAMVIVGRGGVLTQSANKILTANSEASYCKRKLTYEQIMTIGKLKRAMIERDKNESMKSPDNFMPKDKGDNKVSYTITKGIRRTTDSEDFELCGVDAKESAAKVSVTFDNNNEILQVECTSTDTNTWPTINTTVDCGDCEGEVIAIDGDMVWVLKDSSRYETYHKDYLSKPKSPNEKLIEDLADDLVHQDEHITYLDFAKLLIEKYNIKPEDTYE
jgi:hypothetical protein